MKVFICFLNKKSTIFNGTVFFKVLLLITFLSLIISEKKIIGYYLLGTRKASITDVLFFATAFIIFIDCLIKNKMSVFIRKILSILHVLFPLFILILSYLLLTFDSSNYLIDPYLLQGSAIFMIFSFLLLSKYQENKIIKFVFKYVLINAFLFLVIYLCTITKVSHIFIYGEGTPALHFPFNSPNQAALFASVLLMLGVGSALTLGKHKLVYIIIPVMLVVISQTGSRSIMYMLAITWIIFLILIKKKFQHIYLILGTVLSVMLFFLFTDRQGLRSITFFKSSLPSLITGTSDPWRMKAWAMHSNVQTSVHNIYIDFFIDGGIYVLAIFIIFLLSLIVPLLFAIWRNRNSKNYPFYLSMGLAFFIILGSLYSNPILHLRFIWVFWGSGMAMIYNNIRGNNIA